MKAIQMTTFGEPDVLEYKTIEDPKPSNNEVCVKLFAAGVNPNEAYVRTGTYAFLIPYLPYTPGFDGAGIVESVGEDVTHVKVGDRVFVAALLAQKNTGTYAEKVVCDASAVHLLPESVSFEQGAALGIPAVTAYRAIFQRANIKPGETVLIHGASGGVGLLAVQMASSIGATVIGTASSEEGKNLVLQSGAQYVCNHVTEDTIEEILALTNGTGPDVIIEFLANANLETDLKVIAPYGRIVVIGNRGSIEINPRNAMAKECDILGTAVFNIPKKQYEECLIGVSALLKAGVLNPQVGSRLPLSEAKQAHIDIMSKKAKGKIVLVID